MKLEEMIKFAALTDEERQREIDTAQAILDAKESWASTSMSNHRYADCGCGEPYWYVEPEVQKNLCLLFDSNGNVGSSFLDELCMDDLTCTNCNGKPKMPDDWADEFMPGYYDEDDDEVTA